MTQLPLAPSDWALMCEVVRRLQVVETRLAAQSNSFGMLHGDFHWRNLLIDGAATGVIDFDDCGPGAFLFDMTAFLWAPRATEHYTRVLSTFLEAYTRWRNPSSTEIESIPLFIVAQTVRKIARLAHEVSRGERSPSTLVRWCDWARPQLRAQT